MNARHEKTHHDMAARHMDELAALGGGGGEALPNVASPPTAPDQGVGAGAAGPMAGAPGMAQPAGAAAAA